MWKTELSVKFVEVELSVIPSTGLPFQTMLRIRADKFDAFCAAIDARQTTFSLIPITRDDAPVYEMPEHGMVEELSLGYGHMLEGPSIEPVPDAPLVRKPYPGLDSFRVKGTRKQRSKK